jgi:pimeloyl-ACP methyl ester carboxylesterase
MIATSRRKLLLGGAALSATTVLAGCARPLAGVEKVHFVLVHGAWHGAWCWNKVVPLLRAKGHTVTAVDLPGRWSRPESMSQITADDYVESVGQVVSNSDRPVILVGHSLGGATVSMVAEKYSKKIRRSVYLSAFLVPNGKTVGSIASTDKESLIPRAIIRDPVTGTSTVNPSAAREVFYNDCSDDDIRMAVQLLSPEPPVMTRAVMKLSSEAYGSVDRVYIECQNDRAISIATQRAMQKASACSRIVTLESSHSPFLSQASQLVDELLRLS